MTDLVTCPDCGLEYRPRDALKLLCPGCLYREIAAESAPGVADEPRADAAAQCRFRPPKTNELQPHFPQIEIIELLGHGGMSAVYKARQKSVDRIVALKILPLEVAEAAGGVERFARETRTLASLSHPNIVTLYDAGQAESWCYCIMEFISGPNLRQLLGDSRGHWEGDTLVIDTVNFTNKTSLRGAREHLHLVERFTRVGPDTLAYEFTVEDATTFTTNWTAMIPLKRTDDLIYEYACHEGNYGLEGILAGARAEDLATADRSHQR